MQCRQARKILSESDWNLEIISQNRELQDHLKQCPECAALIRAESEIDASMKCARESKPESNCDLGRIRNLAESISKYNTGYKRYGNRQDRRNIAIRRYGLITFAAVFAFLALVPFNFREKVGYEISISGVDRSIMLDNQGFEPLLDALGMEPGKADKLIDSLGKKEVHLLVGECRETCNMKISDLKSEHDVELIINAIIELGCCEIDNVFPIYREQPSSLLKRATQKLFS